MKKPSMAHSYEDEKVVVGWPWVVFSLVCRRGVTFYITKPQKGTLKNPTIFTS